MSLSSQKQYTLLFCKVNWREIFSGINLQGVSALAQHPFKISHPKQYLKVNELGLRCSGNRHNMTHIVNVTEESHDHMSELNKLSEPEPQNTTEQLHQIQPEKKPNEKLVCAKCVTETGLCLQQPHE